MPILFFMNWENIIFVYNVCLNTYININIIWIFVYYAEYFTSIHPLLTRKHLDTPITLLKYPISQMTLENWWFWGQLSMHVTLRYQHCIIKTKFRAFSKSHFCYCNNKKRQNKTCYENTMRVTSLSGMVYNKSVIN